MGDSWGRWVEPIREVAMRLGFPPRETEFVLVDDDAIYQIAAYGLPNMYSHWSFGRDYFLRRQEALAGMSHLYEMVTNTKPAIAYLQRANSLSEQVFVLAHVAGHAAFFDRNYLMRNVRKDLVPYLASARERFRAYEELYGEERVSALIDLGHALAWHSVPWAKDPEVPERPLRRKRTEFSDLDKLGLGDSGSEERREYEYHRWRQQREQALHGVPSPDLLFWLIRHAPMEDWQRDVLEVVREVGLYRYPLIHTKIMDEGFAVWLSLKVLHELDLPRDFDFQQAKLHAGVASAGRLWLNPYWLGWRLWEHLAETGKDVRAICEAESDLGFLRDWIDEDFVTKERLYLWFQQAEDGQEVIRIGGRDWKAIRDRLVELHTHRIPEVTVASVSPGWVQLMASGPLDERDATEILAGLSLLTRYDWVIQWTPPDAPSDDDAEPRPVQIQVKVGEVMEKREKLGRFRWLL